MRMNFRSFRAISVPKAKLKVATMQKTNGTKNLSMVVSLRVTHTSKCVFVFVFVFVSPVGLSLSASS